MALPGALSLVTAPAKYDLLIQGGRVLDASQNIDRLMDVAIRNGKISALAPKIAASDSAKVIDAKGKVVTAGLVDIHCHPRPGELDPEVCLSKGVTTLVDAGSRGANGIDDMIAVSRKAPNRVRVLINISKLGNLTEGELLDIANADPAAARNAIQQHRDIIVGMKARLSRPLAGNNDLEAIRRAHVATGPFNIPLMLHIGDTASTLPQILELLKPGDIVSHVYAPNPGGILDSNGRVMPQVREARRRGIRFDIGNGRNGHITWDVAERAIQQDFLPDSISSDLNGAGLTDQVFDFPTVLSKFLMLGIPLDRVIAMGTVNAARSIPALKEFGTLRVGSTADVSVFELAEGSFDFVDNLNAKKTGKQKLVPKAVVMGGKQVL